MNRKDLYKPGIAVVLMILSSCGASSLDQQVSMADDRHLSMPASAANSDIPEIARPLPLVSPPQPEAALDLYSVVVQDVPIRELLFAMARDASINIDVHSDVTGMVSINALDQSLPQILDRLSRQVNIRWYFDSPDYLVVELDLPLWRSYQIDYVNVSRSSESEVTVASAVSSGSDSGATEGNNSTTVMNQSSVNEFWGTLRQNLVAVLGNGDSELGSNDNIIINPESGLVSLRATSRQHVAIRDFIESVKTRSLYQVLIEATIVEVSLNDRFQAGVDWSMVDRDNGQVSFEQDLLGLNLDPTPTNVLTIAKGSGPDAINATIKALSEFGELKVLSSPKIMALNNQTAIIRVVDSKIYFSIDVEQGTPATAVSAAIPPVFTSEVHTVPVGFTMAVTPQISENDQVTLNVRPTISRIIRFVDDPNPALADADVVNSVPEIQIREIESILKVDSGQIAVLGGLMQDSLETSDSGLPGLNKLPLIGSLFNYSDDRTVKTELIIFIRPVVVKQASLSGDLQQYRQYLPATTAGSR